MSNDSPDSAGPDATAYRSLRPLGAFAKESWSAIRNRGFAIVLIALIVWVLFAACAAALLQWSVDFPRISAIYSRLLDPGSLSNPDSLNQDTDALVSGDWLKAGWWGLILSALGLVVGYLFSSAVATIAVTQQSYAWLTQRKRLRPITSLRYGLRRALPGALLLAAYLGAVICAIIVFAAAGGAFSLFLARSVTTDSAAIEIAAALVGGFLGGIFGIAIAVWIYTRWSLSPYAVALSPNPWTGLRQSAQLTRGHRLDVLIRLILVLLVVGLALTIVALPLDLILGFLPYLSSSSLLPIVLVLYVRIIISALSPLLSAASFTTMYLDLGGETPPPADTTPSRA